MPDETKYLAKGACSQCGRAIAARATAPGPVAVTCNVCKATTTLEAVAPSGPPPGSPAPGSRRWSWPVIVAILGAFFLAGLTLSFVLGGDDAPPDDGPDFTPDDVEPTPGATPTSAVATPTSSERPPGELVRVYVNDSTGIAHTVTMAWWQDDAERQRVTIDTNATPTGPHMAIDPQARDFELRVDGEADGVTLVRAFDAPRCGTSYFEIELVIGDDSRFRWGNVGCAAVSSQL